MTIDDFNELQSLYAKSSDSVKHLVDVEQTNDNADDDGADEPNYFGRICRFARLVLTELETIGLTFPNEEDLLDDYSSLRMLPTLNITLNSDKFLEIIRSCNPGQLQKFLNDCSSEDMLADDWFDIFITDLVAIYPLNTDFQMVQTNSDKIFADDGFRRRISNLVEHIMNEPPEEEL